MEIDSARAAAYVKAILELRPDTVLVLGKVSAFSWGIDSNFVRGDSGMTVTFEHDGTYYSVETGKDGLFHFHIGYSEPTFDIGFIALIGFTIGNAVVTTEAMGFPIFAESGLAFANGSAKAYHGEPSDSAGPDSLCLWGYEFSTDMRGILADFCRLYPSHEFVPTARTLLDHMEVKRVADSLLIEGRFNAARELLGTAYEASPESEYLMVSLVEIHVDRASQFAAAGDTAQALQTLRSCMQLGDTKGLHGGLLKMHLVVAVGSGFYHAPFSSDERRCEFDEQIAQELSLDLIKSIE